MDTTNLIPDTDTMDGLRIRAERQRERAVRWTKKYEKIFAEKEELEGDFLVKIETIKADYDHRISEFESAVSQLKSEKNKLVEDLRLVRYEYYERYTRGKEDGEQAAQRKYAQEIKLGQAELKKREQEKKDRLYSRLIEGDIFESDGKTLVQWIRVVLKKGLYSGTPIVVIPGEKIKPTIQGRRGYHTTPSGKTVVQYPGAYKWRTAYHCSTLRVIVGDKWLFFNKKKLAKKYVKTHKR